MMLKNLSLFLALTLTVTGAWHDGSLEQRRKPTVVTEIPVRRPPPPETVFELLQQVDLVAHVQIMSSEPRRRPIPGGYVPETILTAHVLRKGRDRRLIGGRERIRIIQEGGTFEEADSFQQVKTDNPLLSAGRNYILALNWNEFLDAYVIAHGPDGVFEIEAGRTIPRGSGRAARELKGLLLGQAMDRLK